MSKRVLIIAAAAAAVAVMLSVVVLRSTDQPTARELYQQARDNARAATSAKVTIELDKPGDKRQIEVEGTIDGKNQRAHYLLNGQPITMLSVADTLYVKAPADFWISRGIPAPQAKTVADKYVVQPAGTQAPTIRQILDDSYGQADDSALGNLSQDVQRQTINGVDVYVITGDTEGNKTQVAISADSEPHLVRATDERNGVMNFSKWNAAESMSKPASAEVTSIKAP